MTKTKYKTKTFNGASGTSYLYVMGDRLHYGYMTGTFNGVDVALPATLPHIYLDGKVNENHKGPRYFMRKDQRLRLEGNFNRYFDVYAPRGYQVLALSILTPDVMQTLLNQGSDFDVEIYQNHLRIICNRRVLNRPQAEARLEIILKKVMEEIDHRLRSWSEADNVESAQTTLENEDIPTINAAGGKYRLTTIVLSVIYLPLSALLWGIGINTYTHRYGRAHPTIPGSFLLPFIVFPCVYFYIVLGLPRGWLNWLGRFMDWYDRHR